MPFLIRLIASRILIASTAVLSFLGINPEVVVLNDEDANVAAEERKDLIADILEKKEGKEERDYDINIPLNVPDIDPSIDSGQVDLSSITDRIDAIRNEIDKLSRIVPEQNEVVVQDEVPSIDSPQIDSEQVIPTSSRIKNVVVNIVCQNRNGNKISLATGSGVLISSNGVVLTNAHVAQPYLLNNPNLSNYMNCSIVQENIPTVGYKAELLFISEEWMREKSSSSVGTGELDYALLLITANTNPTLRLPLRFPFISFDSSEGVAEKGDNITVAGYPGTGSIFSLSRPSSLVVDNTFIDDVFTFSRNTTDLISTGETPVANRGSSGGGIFENNKLIGTIVTTSPGIIHDSINALSLEYISRDIKKQTGSTLQSFISGNIINKARSFNEVVVPELLRFVSI